jgi:hypothetical protein
MQEPPLAVETAALVDPLKALKNSVSDIQKERAEVLSQRELYSKSSDQFKQIDERVQDVERRLRDKENELKSEEKRLSEFLEVFRAHQAGVEQKSTKQLERSHARAYELFQRARGREEWQLAGISISLLLDCLDAITSLESDAASKLAASRKEQRALAAGLQKEVADSKAAAEKAASDLAALQQQIDSARKRMSELEKKEANDLRSAESNYEKAMVATQKLSLVPEPDIVAPVLPPSPARPASVAKEVKVVKNQNSFFSRGGRGEEPAASPNKLPPSLEVPFTRNEVDVVWSLLLKGANIPNTDRAPTDFRLSKADYLRAVRNNFELARLFGDRPPAHLLYDAMDANRDSAVSFREFENYMRYPSARRGERRSPLNTRDSLDARTVFDDICTGTTRDL